MGGLMQFFQSLGEATTTAGQSVGEIAGQASQAAGSSGAAQAGQAAAQTGNLSQNAASAIKAASSTPGLGSPSGTSAPMTPAKFVPQNQSTGMPGQLAAGPQTRETFMQKMFGDVLTAWKPQKAMQVPLRVMGDIGGATKAMNRASNAAQGAAQVAGRTPADVKSFAAQPNMTSASGQAVPSNPSMAQQSALPPSLRAQLGAPLDATVPPSPAAAGTPAKPNGIMSTVNRYVRGVNPDGTPAGSDTEQLVRFLAGEAQGYTHGGSAGQPVAPMQVQLAEGREDPNAPSLLELIMQLLQSNSPAGPAPTGNDAGAPRG